MLSLVDKFGLDPQDSEIRVVIADVACGLSRFLTSRSEKNEVLKKYGELQFVLGKY